MVEMIFKIMLLAVCIETIVATLSPLLDVIEFRYQFFFLPHLLSLALGLLAAVTFKVNLFEVLGITHAASLAATGIVIARISNYIHNVFGKVKHGLGDILSDENDFVFPQAQDE